MVLEATMICVGNSEWMRNGDYSPTRFLAQSDAVNLICGAKTQSNPENTVGVLTMAGKGVRVLVTPTSDLGKILACMHDLDIGSEMNLAAGIQIAQLALKHRQNKKQQQRIIVFAGGPVKYDKKVPEMIGRKLKKNSVSLDIVNFGKEDDEKTEKLQALVAAVNIDDISHIVHVPPGSNALSDVLISTPIFTGDGEGGGVGSRRLQLAVYLVLTLMWILMSILNFLWLLEFRWRKKGLIKKLLRRLLKKLHSQKNQGNKHPLHKMSSNVYPH